MNDLKWEPLSINHVEELSALWGDSDVTHYITTPAPCSLEQICSRIDSLSAFDVFVIRMEGEATGIVGYVRMDGPEEWYGASYQLKRIFWGKGFAARTMEQLLTEMKEKSPSVVFYADAVVGSTASKKIL